MASGALLHSSAALAIAVTGIAGPGGGTALARVDPGAWYADAVPEAETAPAQLREEFHGAGEVLVGEQRADGGEFSVGKIEAGDLGGALCS